MVHAGYVEPVTHFLTGACLGRSGFNRRTAYATLTMVLAAEAPDIDIVSGFGGPVAELQHHRGITHTLLGAPLMALIITAIVWGIARLRRKPLARPVRWGWIWLLALIADFSHILLDYTNNYGVRPFFPFDAHWHAWSIVFIFDPVIFGFLLLGLTVPALLGLVEGEMRRRLPGELHGRGWAIAALVGVGLWWGLRNAEHARAIALVQRAGSATREPLLRVAAEPSMANPFTWHSLAETRDGFQLATVQTLGAGSIAPEGMVGKPEVTPAVASAKRSYLGRVYGDWSSWPLVEDVGALAPPGDAEPVPKEAHTVEFRDLRFAPKALDPAARDPVFSGWVVTRPGAGVISEWMDARRQR